jgi:hypothetical protein
MSASVVRDNGGYGIALQESDDRSTVQGTSVTGNGRVGILVSGAPATLFGVDVAETLNTSEGNARLVEAQAGADVGWWRQGKGPAQEIAVDGVALDEASAVGGYSDLVMLDRARGRFCSARWQHASGPGVVGAFVGGDISGSGLTCRDVGGLLRDGPVRIAADLGVKCLLHVIPVDASGRVRNSAEGCSFMFVGGAVYAATFRVGSE